MVDRNAAIEELLTRNVDQVIEKDHLEKIFLGGKKLRIKHGVDPTGARIHIGRAVVLWKLKEFQDLGHKVVLIIGDFTAQIGDPSDKLEKRPFLTPAEIKKNLKNYLPQIGKILDLKKAEIRYNSEWLAKLNFREISELLEIFTVQQMVERNNFAERFKKNEPISMREFLYPAMQGYDSVAVKADVELGGTDQLFNLLAGRKIQERYGQKSQDIMTTRMLIGLDGRKMSTSWGNVINIIDPPDEQFGKVMSMHDDHILGYFELATDVSREEIGKLERDLRGGRNPKEIKQQLAFELVRRYHGEKAARAAAKKFDTLFSKRETPKDIQSLAVDVKKTISALNLVIRSRVVESKSEARRLISQGGFSVNGEVKTSPTEPLTLAVNDILKIGKHRFFRVK